MSRVLFILKFRDNAYGCDPSSNGGDGDYGPCPPGLPEPPYSTAPLSSGLFNSARFVADMLNEQPGVVADIAHAADNNCIDRLVTLHRPDVCVIEAYWVVPEKFDVLTKLHPTVTWVVRNHSAVPFAAMEGNVMDWSLRYMDYANVVLSCNDRRTHEDFRRLVSFCKPDWSETRLDRRVVYLPNFYPTDYVARAVPRPSDHLDVGCFGAVRPLKNHLNQAVAAIRYAEQQGKRLRFHINATRIEGRGEPALRNLRLLFARLPHDLIEHAWMEHDRFIDLMRQMDISLQFSNTETFNIVTADAVMNGVPVATSDEVAWVHPFFYGDPNDTDSMLKAIGQAFWFARYMPFWHPNVNRLSNYDARSVIEWTSFVASDQVAKLTPSTAGFTDTGDALPPGA